MNKTLIAKNRKTNFDDLFPNLTLPNVSGNVTLTKNNMFGVNTILISTTLEREKNKGNKTRNPSSLKARVWIFFNLFESIWIFLNLFESIESICTKMVPAEKRDT